MIRSILSCRSNFFCDKFVLMDKFRVQRQQMVEQQLRARGIHDSAVLEAMNRVPRETFVAPEFESSAYNDSPLPIDANQTISQPYIVALMTQALELKAGERVLEIGTGSGYAAAVLAEIVDTVYTLERHATLAKSAGERLANLGYDQIHVITGDGSCGLPEKAPFDAIVVAAAAPEVPTALKQQLAINGRLVIPSGSTLAVQKLLRIRRVDVDDFQQEELTDVRFVPLIGKSAWPTSMQ